MYVFTSPGLGWPRGGSGGGGPWLPKGGPGGPNGPPGGGPQHLGWEGNPGNCGISPGFIIFTMLC